MQAITVKHLPWTEHRPSRLKAFTPGGHSLTLSKSDPIFNDDYGDERTIAQALADKMDWPWKMVEGGLKNCQVFVFTSEKR